MRQRVRPASDRVIRVPASAPVGRTLAARLWRSAIVVTALSAMFAPPPAAIDPQPSALAQVVAQSALPVPVVRKVIALTFDDLPRGTGAFYSKQERAARLLAGLHEAGVAQAVFFVNPGRINQHDGDAARIAAYVAAGHVIADHSFAHHDLSSMSAAAFLADIDKAEGWLKGQAGDRPWFRFPGLNQGGRDKAKRQAVLAGLAARELRVAPVTIDGLDWHMERLAADARKSGKPIDFDALRDLYVETMVQAADFGDAQMVRILGRSPAHVLLLHDTDLAAAYIFPLVAALRADGWQIVTADAAFADPVYSAALDTPAPNGTLIEALGAARHLSGRLWYDRTDVKQADALFAERVLHRPAASAALPTPAGLASARAVRHAQSSLGHRLRRRAATAASSDRALLRGSGKTA